MKKSTSEKVYLSVINELVKEKNKWEFRAKHPLMEGWCYGKDHPRIGEVLSIFPNILTNGSNI